MLAALKAELRKLYTVRTTYGLTGASLLVVAIYTFWAEGLRAGSSVHFATKLASEVPGAIQTVSLLAGIVAVLLMTHEYRHNTIMYTLTASRRRLTVLAAKFVAISAYAALYAALVGSVAVAMTYLGLTTKGLHLDPQTFPLWDLLWQSLFYVWGLCMAGLLFGVLFRSQVAAIVSLFFVPGAIESILSLWLKGDAKYLPFNALSQVLQAGMHSSPDRLPAGHAAVLFLAYIAVVWVIAAVLFVRRDAN